MEAPPFKPLSQGKKESDDYQMTVTLSLPQKPKDRREPLRRLQLKK
jgi:hypothetical protein